MGAKPAHHEISHSAYLLLRIVALGWEGFLIYTLDVFT
jgi:hypothetical protein